MLNSMQFSGDQKYGTNLKNIRKKNDLVFDIISANCSNLQPVTPRIGTTGEP